MRNPALIVALLGSALGAPQPARADPGELTANQHYAECIGRRDVRTSRALVLSEPGSPAEQYAYASLYDTVALCERRVRGADGVDLPLLRGLLAERLWVGSVGKFERGDRPAPDPDRIDFDAAVRGGTAAHRVLAFCVAYTRPELVDTLLRTEPDSKAEGAAVTELRPVIASCYPSGTSVSLRRGALRGSFAEQLFRRYPPAPGRLARLDVGSKPKR